MKSSPYSSAVEQHTVQSCAWYYNKLGHGNHSPHAQMKRRLSSRSWGRDGISQDPVHEERVWWTKTRNCPGPRGMVIRTLEISISHLLSDKWEATAMNMLCFMCPETLSTPTLWLWFLSMPLPGWLPTKCLCEHFYVTCELEEPGFYKAQFILLSKY